VHRPLSADDVIESPRNPRVLDVLRLHRPRERARRGLLVAEGVWALRTALDAGAGVEHVYFCRTSSGAPDVALLVRARRSGARLTEVSDRALRRLSGRDGPEGVVIVVRTPPNRLPQTCPGGVPLVCIAQAIEKPGNLGAIVRTACAANADLLVVCDPQTDVFSPAAVRASLGAVFLLPVALASSATTIEWLRARDIAIHVTSPQGAADPWATDLTRPSAIVIGNEHRGVSDAWLRSADARIRIPMLGPMNSLNATTAAGVVLFEAVRQRTSARA
jgi:RNA methyltransferase, TrmH family